MATTFPILCLLLLLSFSDATTPTSPNPFTAKAAVIRYWNRKVPNNRPCPSFLVSKLSPLTAVDSATYSSLAATDPSALSSRLPAFCSAARLLCAPTLSSRHPGNSNFATYDNINFTNYGDHGVSGGDSFKNYSNILNNHQDSFGRYSLGAVSRDSSFASYSENGNVVNTDFAAYATDGNGDTGEFSAYQTGSNIPGLVFATYDRNSNSPRRTFANYADTTNVGDQNFSSYGESTVSPFDDFASYANSSNGVNSGFNKYGQDAVLANTTFTSYGDNANFPNNTFKSYAEGGNENVDAFTSYRVNTASGEDGFSSYERTASFAKYGSYFKSYGERVDSFKGYDKGINNNFTFKTYADEVVNFKGYTKNGATFKTYRNSSTVLPPHSSAAVAAAEGGLEDVSGKFVNRWVEPGKFFRERNLKKGTVMPMPDIRDKMPARSFLPRSIAGKIPFSAVAVNEIFKTPADTTMGKAVGTTVAECERAPSRGETKRCATSAEDMIDFAVSVLGSDVVVRSTESTVGSKGNVLIGDVNGINGGKLTKSVSCHQSLFLYLVYYCHSVPKVRVYEADILSIETNEKINHGVAICHIDTSDWSAGHGAFLALGSAPGKIEVCHWIFEGDMTWAAAD